MNDFFRCFVVALLSYIAGTLTFISLTLNHILTALS